jgi:CubicO group peptidase (beta-lactamase class C family)
MKIRNFFFASGSALLALSLLLSGCRRADVATTRSEPATIAEFEQALESLRERLRIPGMSAAIAQDGRVVWARGFGWADRERGVPAGPESIYHLASLTKPYASTVLLQLVEEGRLDLAAPISEFGIELGSADTVRVWHVLSHTSGAPPGTRYRYDGYAFGELEKVIEGTTGRSFAAELTERIIRPLDLRRTAPNPQDTTDFAASGLDRAAIEGQLVQGYAPAWGRRIWPAGLFGPIRPLEHPGSFHPSSGLFASAPDVARFSIALGEGRLLSDSLRARAMSPVVTPAGETLPYGLGWFVQEYQGVTLVWHYGHWFSSSSLIVTVPDRRLTFVLLANSDGLSRWRRLGDHGDLLRSPAATTFLNAFVIGTTRVADSDEHPIALR